MPTLEKPKKSIGLVGNPTPPWSIRIVSVRGPPTKNRVDTLNPYLSDKNFTFAKKIIYGKVKYIRVFEKDFIWKTWYW